MTKKLKSGTPFVYDENDRVVGIRDPHTGADTDLVTAVTGPGGGIAESVGITGMTAVRRADGSVLPLVITDAGTVPLSGFDPLSLFTPETPGEVFDNRRSALLASYAPDIAAADGQAVVIRRGVRNPGGLTPVLNQLPNSEEFDAWTLSNSAVADGGGNYRITTSANGGYVQSLAVQRVAGEWQLFAVEVKPDPVQWVLVGAGGSGIWINCSTGQKLAPHTPGYDAQIIPSTDGYVWAVFWRDGAANTVTASTNVRVYISASTPATASPGSGIATGAGGMLIRKGFYRSSAEQMTFAPEMYNATATVPHQWESYGSYCVQDNPEQRPTLRGDLLDFSGDKSMTVVFDAAPGVCTVARASRGAWSMQTETVGLSYAISADDVYLAFIGRVLSTEEQAQMRDYLLGRAM